MSKINCQDKEYKYGTFLLNKQFEGAHGILKTKIYFEKVKGPVSLVFKFVDPQNFFALEFNYGNSGKVRLMLV